MSPLSPSLKMFDVVPPALLAPNHWGWNPFGFTEGNGVAVAYRPFDIIGWDIESGRTRWRVVEEGAIAWHQSKGELPQARRLGCVIQRGGLIESSVSDDRCFATGMYRMSTGDRRGIRRLSLTDGGVRWMMPLEEIPKPSASLPFAVGSDQINETCFVDVCEFGNRVIVTMVYSGPGPGMLTHLVGLDAKSGRIVWDRVIEHVPAIVDQYHDFPGHWVRDGQLETVNPEDGCITVTALGMPAGVRFDPPQVVHSEVFVPWFWKGTRGLIRVRQQAAVDRFEWPEREGPGRVVSAGGRLYWSGNRMVRSLQPDAAWEYKPGYYVYGIEGVPGGPLWVLSDGAGGALDRLDQNSGALESRFRPLRRGVGSYMRVGESDVLAISVLKTRSERSRDVLFVDMRTGEPAWLGRPALLANQQRACRFLWIAQEDVLQLGAIDPGIARQSGCL